MASSSPALLPCMSSRTARSSKSWTMGWTIRALCAGATTGASSAELPSLNPYGKEAFKTLWGAVRKKLGLAPREITFHDMRAKAASDSDSDESAQELLHHEDVKVTKRVYRRKVPTGTPLPSAIGGRGGD